MLSIRSNLGNQTLSKESRFAASSGVCLNLRGAVQLMFRSCRVKHCFLLPAAMLFNSAKRSEQKLCMSDDLPTSLLSRQFIYIQLSTSSDDLLFIFIVTNNTKKMQKKLLFIVRECCKNRINR